MRMPLALILVLGSAVVLRADSRLQTGQTPAPTGVLMGRVVEATSGTPVRAVLVRLNPGSEGERSADAPAVLTDTDGQFVFGGVPAGGYRLVASKLGYT